MSRVAVVILNFNGKKLLAQFLPSVISNSNAATIYVVDNGSTDESIALLKTNFPEVRIIQLDKNYGFCGGYNKGLATLEEEFFILLNSDVEVTPGWVLPLVALADSNLKIGAIQPKILAYNHKNKFEYAGAGGGFIDTLGYPFCRGRIFDHVEEDEGQYNDTCEVFWAAGACMFVRSACYKELNGLDEDFFAHMEEIDFCWRLNRSGYAVYYNGESTVYHLGAGTLSYNHPRKVFLNFRNGLAMLLKNLDGGEVVYKIPTRILLDWLAAASFLFKGQFKNFLAVFKAHWSLLGSVNSIVRKRKALRAEYPTYSRDTIYPNLIIFDYYLKGKKRIPQP